MSHDPLNDLKHPAPAPSREAVETAWLTACCEFHRAGCAPAGSSSLGKWIWPLSAAAAIGLLCALLFSATDPAPKPSPVVENTLEMENVFYQGQQLFGNRLKAVSISGGKITWHLRQSAEQASPAPQIVTLTIRNKAQPNVHLAGYIDTPIDIEYEGKKHELEFLPNASGDLIAFGNDIYWNSGTPASPITHAKIQTIGP